jgi:hypothetical protein
VQTPAIILLIMKDLCELLRLNVGSSPFLEVPPSVALEIRNRRNGYGTLPAGVSKIDQYASHGKEHTKFWARLQIRQLILLDNSLSAQNYLITQRSTNCG